MTAPNTTNNVTVRKLADVAEGMWNKSKNAFVNASGDTMTGRLTLENAPINQIVTGTGVEATSSSSGGTTTYYPAKWNFDLGIATPSAGDQLVIKIPVAGHDNGTFMSTDNGMTYFPVAQSTGTTRFTTRYPVNAYVFIVFEEYTGSSNSGQVNDCYAVAGSTGRSAYKVGCWRVVNDYDSGNTYDRMYTSNGRFRTGTTGCYPYSLVCLDNTDSYSTLVTSNPGTGVNKSVNTNGKFVYPASILYYSANNTTAAGALVSTAYATYFAYSIVDVRYSSNHTVTFTTHKPVYIECTLNGDGTWSPTAVQITQTLRDGYYYIFLGLSYATEYQLSLATTHPMYYCSDGKLVSAEVARGDITAGTNNGELNVAGTDITVYTHPTDAGNKHIPAGGSSGQFLGWDSAGTAKWVANPNTDIKVKATAKTDNANYKILATASASPTSGAATEAVYDTDITLNPSTNTISANVSGTAASAGKLTTARTTYVTLGTASTSTTRDWSGTTTIPVSGTLGLGNGGTGATSAAGARTNLDVYSKSETESLLNGKVVVVTQLPATGESGVTYYVKDTSSSAVDKYDEYIWAKDAGASTESWIHVGEKSIDLSNYVNALSTSGSGPLVKSLSKSGNTLTATMGTISIDDLSDWATDTDVTVSSVTYHTWWPVAPTSSNQVYGLSIYNGRLYRIYNNKGTYSAQAYDTNTTYTNKSLGQGYGTCATDAATAAKIVTMSDYALTTGGIVTVKFTNALCTSATMNINGKGAKPIYIKGAAVTANNAATVSAGDTAYFMYDGTAYHLLGTDRAATNPIVNISRSGTTFTATRLDGTTFTFTQQDNNTTYTQAKLGQGYGTCTTAEATAAKSVTLTGYELEPNGVVAVKFTNGLCASATMSINGKTATPIYINGAAVTSTSCKEVLAGDLAFFIYDGSHYQFICTDRISKNGITGLSISGKTITYTRADGSTGTLTTQDTTYTFDGVYNSSSNKAATVSTVTNAVNALDVDDITGFGAGKTLATLTETDGKIAATFQNISITKSQVSDFSHSHGNITNDGKVGTTADYAVVTTTGGAVTATSLATSSPTTSGNTLEFIDTVSQNSKGKISATKKKVTIDDTYSSTGTNPVSGKAIAAAIETLDVTEVGGDGKYIKKIKEDNGKITATVETMDTTPTASSTKAVTSGGIKTALDAKADDSNVVHKTGNETVGGTKTFSDETVFSTVHRDTRYASNLCNYFETNKYPTNVVVWTKCRWASGVVMPIIRIYGNSYNPYGGAWELKISFYVYNDALTKAGVVSIGNYKPAVYLWKYTDSSDNKDYVAVGLSTDPANTSYQWYFRGFQVDVQLPASGYDWYYVNRTGWSTSSNGADTTQVIIPEEGTSGCVKASYLSLSTDISGNAATASAAQTGSALETAIDSKANIANSVYYVVGSHSYASWAANTTYAANDNVVYSNRVYYCKTAHTSTSSFDSSKWTYLATVTLKGTADGITTISTGLKIAYKMPAIYGGNTSTYLNINNLGSYYIKRNNGNMSTHIPPNAAAFFVFDGTAWQWADYDSNTNNWVTTMGAYCDTVAATAAKVATSTNTVLTAGMSFLIRIVNTNTSAGKLTLNINSTGAKDVWINGAVSSSSNYTLPAGEHWCHYDGTVYHIWTDGSVMFKELRLTTKLADDYIASATTWNAKQDALATQTAYSAKGTATKVPQITTNSLGQVTGITEVTISGVTPASHTHGNIANGGTLTDTAAAAAGNDYVVIRDADNAKIQTSTIKGTDVADAVSKKHSHSTLTLSTTAQAYDGSHTLALPSTDPYTSARTPAPHSHGNITNDGSISSDGEVAISNNCSIVYADNTGKVKRSTVKFDGSTTAKALTQKGTFEAFLQSHQDISGKEDKSNKVTAWQSTPDNTHYPSEKLVNDELKNRVFIYRGLSEIDSSYTWQNTYPWQVYNAMKNNSIAYLTLQEGETTTADSRWGFSGVSITYNLIIIMRSTGAYRTVAFAYPNDGGEAFYMIVKRNDTGICTWRKLLHSGSVTSSYSSTGTDPVNGAAIAAALGTLDVSSVGGAGKYISAIAETNGKISATATTMDTTPTASSTNAVTSGGIKTALDGKQNTLATQTAYTSKGTSTKVPQITTNTLGQVTGITEVEISGVEPAPHEHEKLSYTNWENASLPNNTESGVLRRFYCSLPNYNFCVKLFDVTQFYDGTIVDNGNENSTFVGDVSFHRLGGGTLVGKSKVVSGIAYNSTWVRLYGDNKFCHPIILKDSREIVSTWISGSYIRIGDVGSTVSLTPTSNSNLAYCVIDCSTYSSMYINSNSVTGAPTWAFIDSTNKILTRSSGIGANSTVEVPQGAVKLICNIKNTTECKTYCYVAIEAVSPKYYLALQTEGVTMSCYMVCDGRFYTRMTATNTIAARPLLTSNYILANLGASSPTIIPAGCSIQLNTIYNDVAGTLGTARKLAVSLSNTSTDTTFNGSADVTNIKVTGTLPVTNGGTGKTTVAAAEYNLLSKMGTDLSANAIADTYRFVFAITSQSEASGRLAGYRTASSVWSWIKDKMSSDTSVDISGHADSATYDSNGNTISENAVYYVAGTTDYAAWQANKAYAVNDTVNYSNQIRVCKTAHTSGSSYDSSKWNNLGTPVLKGTINGITALYTGLKIAYKWPCTGGSSSTYLNINNLGNVYIRRNDGNITTHVPTNTVTFLAYDGTYWRWADYDSDNIYAIHAYCGTAAATQAKTATAIGYVLAGNPTFLVKFTYANTYAGKITLNINSQGAKDIWINGAISSATNYTVPVGLWWCHYDGSAYHIWTDGSAEFKELHLTDKLSDDNIASAATWNAKQDAITYMTVAQENELISELGEL